METAKKIINIIYGVDIDEETRKRPVVDARRAYSKILRDAGYSFQYIASTLNKDHTSIVHYVKSIEPLLEYDSAFKKKFILVKQNFLEENKNLRINSKKDIYAIAISLEKKLIEITSKKEELKQYLDNCETDIQKEECINYCRTVILPLLDF